MKVFNSMPILITRLLFILTVLGGSLPTVMAQRAEILTSAEIAKALIGKTVKQVDDQYWAFYEPMGTVGGLYVNDEDQGRWGFVKNQLCQQWDRWNRGQPMCFYVLRGVGGAFRFDNGQGEGFNVVVKAGNPMELL